jgi:hypothetical protein
MEAGGSWQKKCSVSNSGSQVRRVAERCTQQPAGHVKSVTGVLSAANQCCDGLAVLSGAAEVAHVRCM